MAGMLPSFVTGANAKIKAGGKTFAYAQEVSYRVTVDVVPVETMGRYEAASIEPVNFSVAGELSIVRYTKVAKNNGIHGADSNGNGLGNVNWVTGGNAADQINPGNILMSKTWDLEIFQKIQTAAGATPVVSAPPVIKLTDCRFNSKGGGMNKRGILVERLGFVAILASDDSFTSTHSGDVDLST